MPQDVVINMEVGTAIEPDEPDGTPCHGCGDTPFLKAWNVFPRFRFGDGPWWRCKAGRLYLCDACKCVVEEER